MADDVAKYPFSTQFELHILRLAIADPQVMFRIGAYIDPDRLKHNAVAQLMAWAVQYHQEKKIPATALVLEEIGRGIHRSGKLTEAALLDAMETLDEALSLPSGDIPAEFVIDKVLEEARHERLLQALRASVALHEAREYDEISQLVNDAVQIGAVDTSPGTDAFTTIAQRTANRQNPQHQSNRRLRTGLHELDADLGGLAPGELGVVMAPPKFGKSMFLNTVAYYTVSVGGTVVYISLEMSEEELLDRFDAAVSRVTIKRLSEQATLVEQRVQAFQQATAVGAPLGCGQFVVKFFPSNSVSARDLDHYLQSLRTSQGIHPTLVIVDSGDFCVPSFGRGRNDNSYETLGAVYTELKGLAGKWQVPVWTGSWTTRESVEKTNIGMNDVSSSFKKVGVSDVGLAICGTEEEREAHQLRIHVAYSRFAGMGGMYGPYMNRFDIGLLCDLDTDDE